MSRSPYYIREDIFENVGDSARKKPKPPSYATPSTGSSWLPPVSEVPRRNIRAVEPPGRVTYMRDIDVTTHTTRHVVNATKEVKWKDDVTVKADAQRRVEDTYINNARRPQTPFCFESPSEKVSNPWMIENQKKYSNAVDNVNKKYMKEARGLPSPVDSWATGNDHTDEQTCQKQTRSMGKMEDERDKMVNQIGETDLTKQEGNAINLVDEIASSSLVDSVEASIAQQPRLASLVRPLNTEINNDFDDNDTYVQILPKPPSQPKKKRDKKKRHRHNNKIPESNEETIQNDLESNGNKEPAKSITFQPHPPTVPKQMIHSVKPHPPTAPKQTIHSMKPHPPTVPKQMIHSMKPHPPTAPKQTIHSVKPHPPTAPKQTIHSMRPHPPTAPKQMIHSMKPHPPTAPKPVLPNISRKTYRQTNESLNTPISKEEEERRFKQEQDKLRFNLRVTRKIMEENNVNNGALNAEARKKWKQATFYD